MKVNDGYVYTVYHTLPTKSSKSVYHFQPKMRSTKEEDEEDKDEDCEGDPCLC